MKQRVGLAGVVALLVAVAACAGGGEAPAPARGSGGGDRGTLSVYVVNYPLMYFAERIGGEHVTVTFPAPADVDPAFWEPDVTTIAAYQSADLIVRNGAGYAAWTIMASLPESKVVDTSRAFADQVIVEEGAVTHSHGPQGEHSHGASAFTTWLDLHQATQQAEAIAAALSTASPQAAGDFERNVAALRADLEQLDARLMAITAQLGDTPLLGSHPVYQYLARRYGMNLRSVHFEPGEMPTEEAWQQLAQLHERHPATIMLWESQPAAQIAARLQQMGIATVVFDPAANRPADGDFLSVMRTDVANLEEALIAP